MLARGWKIYSGEWFVDSRLVLKLTDPDLIDAQRHTKVGFEAYASHIQIRNIRVRSLVWQPRQLSYAPEW